MPQLPPRTRPGAASAGPLRRERLARPRPALAGLRQRPLAPWQATEHAFGYFRTLKPSDQIGHSILIYRITPEDAARLAPRWRAVPRASAGR